MTYIAAIWAYRQDDGQQEGFHGLRRVAALDQASAVSRALGCAQRACPPGEGWFDHGVTVLLWDEIAWAEQSTITGAVDEGFLEQCNHVTINAS